MRAATGDRVKRRVMVVDDEPLMLESARMVLDKAYDVAAFEQPSHALQNVVEFRPDLAILDIQRPEMDGFELMRRLKEALPGLDVILMTGSVGEADKKLIRAIENDAFYFLIKPFERKVLLTLVDRCLEQRRLSEAERRHTRRVEGELEQARAFQRSLMPPAEGRSGDIALFGHYRSADELCGDFYDYADQSFLVADVSNHGASAAMVTGMIKLAFRSARQEDFAPVAVAERIGEAVANFPTDHFVTFFCGRVRDGRLDYVNAGHPPALYWRGDGAPQPLRPTARLVHPFIEQPPLRPATIDFPENAGVLLYTDGITEAKGEKERFEQERLEACIRRHPHGGATLVEAILKDLEAFVGARPIADDLTLLAVNRR